MSKINKRHFNCKVKSTPNRHLAHVCSGSYFNIMKEIQLSKSGKNRGKYVALVDDEDFERVNKFKWQVEIGRSTIYAVRLIRYSGRRNRIGMHNFILDRKIVDHINGNGLNNQRYNIRPCTNEQNNRNSRPRVSCSSIYKGVKWNKINHKWTSSIRINNKDNYLGSFIDEVEAAKQYDKKAKEIFKEFAYLNFP